MKIVVQSLWENKSEIEISENELALLMSNISDPTKWPEGVVDQVDCLGAVLVDWSILQPV